jgi:TRAP-type mannitol/chloroaromatic compound transport system permease small subunit
MNQRLKRFVAILDSLAEWTGRLVSWLVLVMVLVTFLVVVMRYAFGFGRIWIQELSTWAHALVFLLAAAYTLKHDEHVRVDVFYKDLTPRRRALVDLLGTLLLLIPVCLVVLWSSWDYAASAWSIGESSGRTGGLPALYLLKSAIPAAAILLLVQALALLARAVLGLRGVELRQDRHDFEGGGEGL